MSPSHQLELHGSLLRRPVVRHCCAPVVSKPGSWSRPTSKMASSSSTCLICYACSRNVPPTFSSAEEHPVPFVTLAVPWQTAEARREHSVPDIFFATVLVLAGP